jgi:zinc protease
VRRALLLATIAACCPASVRPAPVTAGPTPTPTPTPPPTPTPTPTSSGPDWAAAGIDWSKPPAAWPERKFTAPRVEQFQLPNGVHVQLIENHRLPLVSVRVLSPGAGSSMDGARAGIASITTDLLDQGAGKRSATELPEELERLGAHLEIGTHADHAALTLDTLAETLEPSLALAADVLIRPRLAAADFERVKAERLADLALRPDQPRAIAGLVFERVIFGDHPYGSPGAGWPETIAALTLRDVKRFWKDHYGAGGSTIVVAGDVTRAQLEPMLRRTFGRWKGRRPYPPEPDRVVPRNHGVLAFVDRPGAEQSVVTIGGVGPDIADAYRVEFDLITTAVGGSFSARLNNRLREQLGYTYGAYASVWRGRWSGAWSVTSAIRTDATAPAIKEVIAILRAAGARVLPDDELARTRSLMILSLPQQFETNAATASAYANLVTEQRGTDSYRDLPQQIEVASPESGRAAASVWWAQPDVVVVGDWAAIGNDVAKLGLQVVRYSADGRPLK